MRYLDFSEVHHKSKIRICLRDFLCFIRKKLLSQNFNIKSYNLRIWHMSFNQITVQIEMSSTSESITTHEISAEAQKPAIAYKNQTILASGAKLFMDEETADVHFLLESKDGTIHQIPAHKCQLAIASDVFKAMFYGPAKEKGDVKITDINVSAFKEFLQFFYLHQITLKIENFGDVMNFGKKYNVIECLNIGLKFLKDTELAIDDVFPLYELAIVLDLKEIKQICEKHIIVNTEVVFDTTGFLTCKHDTLNHILQIDTMSCDESEVFKACMAWTVSVGQDTLSKDLVQTHLGQLFYDIRFRSISIDAFACLLQTYDHVFTAEEKCDILQLIALKNFQPKMFNRNLRQHKWDNRAIIECNRILEKTATFYYLPKIHTTTFSTTEPVLLGKFVCLGLYVHRDGEHHFLRSELPMDVEIIETDEKLTKILSTMKSCIKSNSDTIFTLPKPILIRPGFRYKIELKQSVEGHCYKAKTLKSHIKIDSGIDIQFYDDPTLDNDINKIRGLITTLKFNRIQ